MSSYNTLKSEVAAVVKTNGQNEITGANMQSTLNKIIDCFGGYWLFGGLATPGTNPGTPDQNVAWLALIPGTYTKFNNLNLKVGNIGILYWDSGHFAIWQSQVPFRPAIVSPNIIAEQNQFATKSAARKKIPDEMIRFGLLSVYYLSGTEWVIEASINSVADDKELDASWSQIYPARPTKFTRGIVNILAHSPVRFENSGLTWTAKIAVGTEIIVDGANYGLQNHGSGPAYSGSYNASVTINYGDEVGVFVLNTAMYTTRFIVEPGYDNFIENNEVVLFTFGFNSHECSLKDSMYTVVTT